jgi:excisionase family DNA binding protein
VTRSLSPAPPPTDAPGMENPPTLADIDARLARIEAALMALTTGAATHPATRARARAALGAIERTARPEPTPVREYLSTAQAAEELRVSPDVVRRMIRRGDLDAVPIGYGEGRAVAWRIPVDALDRLPRVGE